MVQGEAKHLEDIGLVFVFVEVRPQLEGAAIVEVHPLSSTGVHLFCGLVPMPNGDMSWPVHTLMEKCVCEFVCEQKTRSHKG